MRILKSAVAVASAFLVMGCQTVAGAGSAGAPVPLAVDSRQASMPVSVAPASGSQSDVATSYYATSKKTRRNVLIAAGIAVVIIVAVLLTSGDGDGGLSPGLNY